MIHCVAQYALTCSVKVYLPRLINPYLSFRQSGGLTLRTLLSMNVHVFNGLVPSSSLRDRSAMIPPSSCRYNKAIIVEQTVPGILFHAVLTPAN